MGTPLIIRFRLKLGWQGPTLVLHFSNHLINLHRDFPDPEDNLINPRASAPHECWSKLDRLRGHHGATRGLVPVGFSIRRVLRTRYAAPIGIVDTSGGLAGLVLPLTRYLVHRDSGDALGNLRVEVFH